jgi:CubicO group peptidase (beta-lactamase class C family)
VTCTVRRVADGSIDELAATLDRVIAECAFSGVVRIDRAGQPPFVRAAGYADRRWSIPMTPAMRLSTASATKGFTALTVMALVEAGVLTLDTTARALLGDDLPLIDDGVTVEHLLAHRSGIGDYLDEEKQSDISDHVAPVPVHQLDSIESCLAVLDGYPQVSPPGAKFAYNNGGFVVLALLAERAARRSYYELVDELVLRPAALGDTAFIRSDALPPGVATG